MVTASAQEIRHALGHFATGVTVVTSLGPDGEPVGTTASAVSSLSLDPPLLLVCLDAASATLAALRHHGTFAINVLAAHQQPLSGHFAQRGATVSWNDIAHRRGETGAPVLHDVLAALECELERCLDGGDHEIVVGRLRELDIAPDAQEPLLHFRGEYASLVPTCR